MPHYINHRELAQSSLNSEDECIFILPKEYGYVVVVTSLVAFLYIFLGMYVVGQKRKKVFSPHFMEQFQSTHQQYYTSDITKSQGYPDMGNGYYSQKLPYDQWREFNAAQRIHYNFLESITPIMFFLLVAGLQFPWVSVGLGITVFIGRILYARYLSNKGAQDIIRILGSSMSGISLILGFIFSVISGFKISCAF